MSRPEISAGPLGDIDTKEFRAAAHRAVEWAGDYLDTVGERRVLSQVSPGDIRRSLPTMPPEQGEALDAIFTDFERLVLPGITHWNHPRFFGYFGITGSAPGILAELLIAALNVNGMLWRTSPAATEVEEVACDWLRQAIGLPEGFSGVINDTASSSTLYALAAAREAIPEAGIRRRGMPAARLRLYTSEESHSSVEKAGIVLGVGQDNGVKIHTDSAFRMDPRELRRAIERDRRDGHVPFAVVATVGTTSVTAAAPVPEIAAGCQAQGRRFRSLKLWFVLRAFGVDGARRRIAAQIGMAQDVRAWIEADPDFELLAPSTFSTVVFRHRAGDAVNERIHDEVNRSGVALISHTDVRGVYALRIAIGNLRTTLEDVRITWELIKSRSET